MVDFSNCPQSPRHGQYAGQAGDKDGIVYDGSYWIVKYPKSTRSMQVDETMRYTTSPLSEYIYEKGLESRAEHLLYPAYEQAKSFVKNFEKPKCKKKQEEYDV